MNLKNKIALIVSLLFTLIFAVSASVVYILFADFRAEEFESRLKEKAVSSIKLLVEVEQVDRHLLKIIDQNSIDKLYNEKTLIFDADFNLIYSSLDDTKITWTIDDLKYLKVNKTFFKKDKEHEIYGVFYDTKDNDFYALISATDIIGKRKLAYLLYLLIVTYIVFTIICWFTMSYLVKKLLAPVDTFHGKLKGINENHLDTRIVVKDKKDEIDLLADEFNKMLERIAISYHKQKEFTSNASHELRTPIARITTQLENKIIIEKNNRTSTSFLEKILEDVYQISELISSLLLLSKLDNTVNTERELCRIDELFFDAAEKVSKLYPDFKLELDILSVETLEIFGNKSLLLIAFTNLLKNAYLYSDNKQVGIRIKSSAKNLVVSIANDGQSLTNEEQTNLFQPFMRGQNSKDKAGLGLGLRIVQRILVQQNATIMYVSDTTVKNDFIITFPL